MHAGEGLRRSQSVGSMVSERVNGRLPCTGSPPVPRPASASSSRCCSRRACQTGRAPTDQARRSEPPVAARAPAPRRARGFHGRAGQVRRDPRCAGSLLSQSDPARRSPPRRRMPILRPRSRAAGTTRTPRRRRGKPRSAQRPPTAIPRAGAFAKAAPIEQGCWPRSEVWLAEVSRFPIIYQEAPWTARSRTPSTPATHSGCRSPPTGPFKNNPRDHHPGQRDDPAVTNMGASSVVACRGPVVCQRRPWPQTELAEAVARQIGPWTTAAALQLGTPAPLPWPSIQGPARAPRALGSDLLHQLRLGIGRTRR